MYENSKNINFRNPIKFTKKGNNNYNFSFSIENKNYVLKNIINFELIQLIYKLNDDIYESIHTEKIDENESNITLVMKKIFFDLISQKYAFLNVKKEVNDKTIVFNSRIINSHRPPHVKDDFELVDVENIVNKFEIIDNHKINCNFEFIFNNRTNSTPIFDKVFVNFVNKMFVRFKNSIESLK